MPAPTWRNYYHDGSTFDSNDGRPCDAPGYGIVCIVQTHPEVGRTVTHRFDWYFYSPTSGEWWGSTDLFSVMGYVLHRAPILDPTTICQGWHSADYDAILDRARADADFPTKSGLVPTETPVRSF